MAKNVKQYYVFISCPDDVEKEKQIVREVCNDISDVYEKSKNLSIKPIDWRKDVEPSITGEGAQSVIDEQIKEYDYDLYIGIMWKQFGDEQSNGLSPTEGEFEDALKRMKANGRPEIKLYFKNDKFSPRTSDDAYQSYKVQKFKEKIKNLDPGLYGGFEGKDDFRRKINKAILYAVENFNKLTSIKTKISKIKYISPPSYLNRKVIPVDKNSSETFLFRHEFSQDIVDVIKHQNRIVLLGDAGNGKTTELRRIAGYFSKNDYPLYPHYISLNKYVNQTIPQILPNNWSEIPEDQLLIILDGLDEIESKNKNDAIRQIELFAEQHPNSHIIVSCRTNFYISETNKSTGTLSSFLSFVLLGLENEEIEKYIRAML